MIKNTNESDFPPGEEGNKKNPSEIRKLVTTTTKPLSSSTMTTTTSSSTPWLRLKDPRIVRVSRVFGGKDRHSKVCTIRGLRDRRVRLSVPTAIQLYDLQDRLGLNQPSKVVDWLLNAAKHEIDELPPLPIPPGSIALLMPRDVNNNASTSQSSHAKNIVQSGSGSGDHDHSTNIEWDQLGHNSSKLSWSNFWCTTSASANKEVIEKENLRVGNEGQDHQASDMVIGNSFLQRANMNMINHQHPFFPGMLNSVTNSGGYRWEAPNYPLLMSNLGGGLTDHSLYNFNNHNSVVSLDQPSTLSLLSTGSQFIQGNSASASTSSTTTSCSATQTYFPNPQVHMLSSNSAQTLLPNPMRSLFHFGMSNNNNTTNDNGNTTSQQSEEGE